MKSDIKIMKIHGTIYIVVEAKCQMSSWSINIATPIKKTHITFLKLHQTSTACCNWSGATEIKLLIAVGVELCT